MDAQKLDPVKLSIFVGIAVAIATVVAMKFFKGGKDKKAIEHEKKQERVRETVKEHLEKKAVAEQHVAAPAPATVSTPAAAIQPANNTPEAAVAEPEGTKKRKGKKKDDPDTALIALFDKGKKSNKNKTEKSKQRKKHPKHVASAGGYNSDEADEDDEQIIFAKSSASISAVTATSAPSAAPEVTASMLAAAVETQIFVSEEPAVKRAHPNALEIANLKQLELSAELEASLIAGLSAGDNADHSAEYIVSSTTSDGWAVVEDKRKVRMTKKQISEEAAASLAQQEQQDSAAAAVPEPVTVIVTPPAPLVIDITKTQVFVEPNKVGAIVGPKGSTLKALQEATGVEIIAPRYRDVSDSKDGAAALVTIHLVGPSEGVTTVTKAIEDLCNKGYTAILEGPDFGETTINVHQTHVADIIGKGGIHRRTLQEQLGVRIIVPPNNSSSASEGSTVKVGIAGPRMKVSETKKLLKELVRYHHCPITHPDIIHVEYEATHMYFNYLNTCRPSEIRNIQNNYKVTVFLPTEHSVCKNILLVGDLASISNAQLHLQKQIEQATIDSTAAVILSEAWSATNTSSASSTNTSNDINTNINSIVANELGSSISNPWLGGLVSPPVGTNGNAGAGSSGGWDPTTAISSAEGW